MFKAKLVLHMSMKNCLLYKYYSPHGINSVLNQLKAVDIFQFGHLIRALHALALYYDSN